MEAIVVKSAAKSEIKTGDTVLVGIRCIWTGIRFEPVTPGFRLTKNIFDGCEEKELVLLKPKIDKNGR